MELACRGVIVHSPTYYVVLSDRLRWTLGSSCCSCTPVSSCRLYSSADGRLISQPAPIEESLLGRTTYADVAFDIPTANLSAVLVVPQGLSNTAGIVLLVHGTASTGNQTWGESYVLNCLEPCASKRIDPVTGLIIFFSRRKGTQLRGSISRKMLSEMHRPLRNTLHITSSSWHRTALPIRSLLSATLRALE